MNPPTAAGSTPLSFHPAASPDYVPRELREDLQWERLRETVARAYEHSGPFRQRMQKQGLTPADVRSLDDLARLPFTLKSDLADAYPQAALAVPLDRVARLRALCGGLPGGKDRPIVVAFTRADLEACVELWVRSLVACGVGRGDVLLCACSRDPAAAGEGLAAAAERLGATVVVAAGGDVDRHVRLVKDFGVAAVFAPPGYFLQFIERAAKLGIDLGQLPWRLAVVVAEASSESVGRRVEEAAGIKVRHLVSAPSLGGPGVGCECGHGGGPHLFEDHFYPEVVEPASGRPLADGEEGELVLTTLSREAQPLVRFRTGELTAIVPEPCPCGRTLRRVRPLRRPGDDVLVIEGTSVLPSQIEAALVAVEGTLPRYRIVLTQADGADRAEVEIEVTPEVFSDRMSVMEGLQNRIAAEIERALGIRVAVRLVEPQTIGRDEGQRGRIVDRRGS